MRREALVALVAVIVTVHANQGDRKAIGGDAHSRARAAYSLDAPLTAERKICSSSLPVDLAPLGLPNICLKVSLPDGAKCSYGMTLAVEFEDSNTPLFQAPINLATLTACATAANLTGSPFPQYCGTGVQVCVDFHKHGESALSVGPDFVSGCPSLFVKQCVVGGVTLPPIPVTLGCFSIGEDCARFKQCDECLLNGCGWCTAGVRDNFKCMAGNAKGPACNGECGSDCLCEWHHQTCPESDVKFMNQQKELNATKQQLVLHHKQINQLHKGVANGSKFPLDGDLYECLPSDKAKGEARGHSVVTAVVSVVAAFLGLGVGVVLGKMGFWDKVFNRGGDGGLSDIGIYNRHDV